MFKPVSSKVDFVRQEEATLEFWKDRNIFKKVLEQGAGKPIFVFYEGPPTANGRPGIHHVLARVFKDVIPRHRTMKGYCVPRKAGWDTHGLPVELEVEKALGFSGKPQIEAYGIAEFNQKCRESVWTYVKEWESLTDRIGFWIDLDDAYVTYHNSYIETCWWIIKQLWDRNLVYQDYKVTPYCPRCGTSLSSHEVALGYKDDVSDPSVYVKFKILPESAQALNWVTDRTFFLVWTTTPWTLPGNAAVAVKSDATYAVVELANGDRLVLAEALLEQALREEYELVARVPGYELVGLRYEPLYRFLPIEGDAHMALAADFVSLEDGTGIVHLAPAFGEIDLEIGREHGLPVIQTVDLRGEMIPESGAWAGMFVKEADPLIIRNLEERGLLERADRILHTYPFCWRCDTPLLYYAKPSWYIRTTAIKDRLLAGNEKINWYPEHIKWGRFGEWLRNNVDWALSRERYWGTPLNIWRCESCGKLTCVGSVAELKASAVDPSVIGEEFDLHRPYVDEVQLRCDQCGGTATRTPEVIDVWFDSGAMPLAQWHFPFEQQATFVERFPADYICEAVDQTRGWFYSLHAIATLLFGKPSFLNVICLGHILDEHGLKMSKSRGNVVEPWDVLNSYGADALRWYLFTASVPGNPRRFAVSGVGDVVRRFMLTLWNTYSFFVTYANLDGWTPTAGNAAVAASSQHELDRWILSELNDLIERVDDALEHYDPTTAGRAIEEFVDELSNWYVRRSRRRFWKSESDVDKATAYATLYESLTTVSRLLAPFMPFLAEEIYQNLVRFDPEAPESVHMADFPVANPALIDRRLSAEMRIVMRIVSLGRAVRIKSNIRVRQPVQTIFVGVRTPEERTALERLAGVVLDELNAKELRFADEEADMVEYVVKPNFAVIGPKYGKGAGQVAAAIRNANAQAVVTAVKSGAEIALDGHVLEPNEVLVEVKDRPGYVTAEEGGYLVALSTELSPKLIEEGLARELVHRIQTMRKAADFEISDRITLYLQGDDRIHQLVQDYADYIQAETLAERIVEGAPPETAHQETTTIEGVPLKLGVERVTN